MKLLSVTVFCLVQFVSLAALAQGAPPLRRWEASAFGGERQVWDIASAPDGTIAVANAAGLLLFDGVRWQRRVVPNGQVLRTVIYHTRDSSWWAGGYDGWWRWPASDPTAGAEYPTTAERVAPPADPKEEWWHVLPDPERPGALLWQTFSRFVRQPAGAGSYEPLPTPGNILFAKTIRDTLFLPVIGRGLHYRSRDAWRVYPGGEAFAAAEVAGLAPAKEGGLLVATRGGQLFRLRGGRAQAWPTESARAAWRGQPLNGLLALRTGGYALATAANGLYLLADDGRIISHLDAQRGLGDDTVLSLHQDEGGGLWVGLNDGLVYLSVGTAVSIYATELGPVYDVLPIPKGLLLSTNEGLYLRAGDLTGPVSDITEQVWHVTPTSAGIVAGTNDGTFLLDEQLRATRISRSNGGWAWLELDSTRSLAGTYVGIERYEKSPEGSWMSAGRVRGLSSPVRQLHLDPGDGTGHAFYVVHPQEGLSLVRLNDSLTTVVQRRVIDSLPGKLVPRGESFAYHTSTRTLQLGSGGQIVQATLEPLSVEITSAGRSGRASLTQRLLRVKFDGVKSGGPDTEDGGAESAWPLDVRLDYPLLEQLPDGFLLVGLHRGFALIDMTAAGAKVLKLVPVRVTTEQRGNSVEVSFAQARYDRAPVFRVRLVGSDTSFAAWTSEGEYLFPQLKAGAYALDWESDDGQGGRVHWEVAPPWYQHPVVYLVYGLLIGAGFWAIRIYYRRRLVTQQRLADIERERLLQAERLRTRANRLEDRVKVSEREVELSHRELALRQNELEQRNRELAQSTLAQARHNESLLQIKEGIANLPKSGEIGKTRRQLNHVLETQLSSAEDWVRFDEHFDAVHVGFLHQLHEDFPELTPGDLRLAALLRMNLPSKELAPLLHLSLRGVENKRYRLRKKLGLAGDANLTDWVLSR